MMENIVSNREAVEKCLGNHDLQKQLRSEKEFGEFTSVTYEAGDITKKHPDGIQIKIYYHKEGQWYMAWGVCSGDLLEDKEWLNKMRDITESLRKVPGRMRAGK